MKKNYKYKLSENTKEYYSILSKEFPELYKQDKFCVNRKVKRRYINPLTKSGRMATR